jgi:hypothetical protein
MQHMQQAMPWQCLECPVSPVIACNALAVHVCSLYTNATISMLTPGNTKGGSITVPLTSCLTGLVSAV